MSDAASLVVTDGEALSDYDYDLPEDRIALRPVSPRDAARLLVAQSGALSDRAVRELPQLLAAGDRLVVNDSRVIPARLIGERLRGDAAARVELTLLGGDGAGGWHALARPARRLAPDDRVRFPGTDGFVDGTVTGRDGATVALRFGGDPLAAGTMPLPPYIAARRAADDADRSDYQTVYARPAGSVAAPTAGLHFTDALLASLAAADIGMSRVTLHVGAGTFLPVKTERLDDHEMHAERGEIGEAAVDEIRATRAAGGRVVAVGTTALRLLETAAASGELRPYIGETRIFIRPGFRFGVADALMTNFHMPRTTLLMLVAAFVGLERMRAIYAHALAHSYRFASYGDSSLLFRAGR